MTSFFLLLGVFYLHECLLRLSPGQRFFAALWGRFHRPGGRFALRLLDEHRFVIPAVLPAVGGVFVALHWEAIPHPDGICWRVGTRWRFVAHREVRSIEARSRGLWINGEKAAVCRTPEAALQLCTLLDQIRRLDAKRRKGAVGALLGKTFDLQKIDERLDRFERETGSLRLAGGVLALFLFLVMPLEAWYFGPERIWVVILLQLGLAQAVAGVWFWWAHRGIYPEKAGERLGRTLGVAMWPPAALRSREQLGLGLLETFDALAIAQRLCRPEDFKRLAGQVLLDVEMEAKLAESDPDCPGQVASWLRDFYAAALGRFLASVGVMKESLLVPPEPDSREAKSYCSRCLGQYRRAAGECPECRLALSGFKE